MKRIKFLCVLLLGVVWMLSPFSALAENWPIKEFRVFKENPDAFTANDVEVARLKYKAGIVEEKYYEAVKEQYQQQQLDQQNSTVISDVVVGEIERWLKRVAQEYEAMGFMPPLYTDIDSSIFNNKKAYKVYVYPFSDGGQAGMLPPCGYDGEEYVGYLYMKVDSSRNIENGKLTTKAYQDLAHELFHAVQYSYDLFKGSCEEPPGAWITEGTAEIVGIEMARKLKGKTPFDCQMGVRRYAEELYVRELGTPQDSCGSRAYHTQSFWQFLGEYSTRKVKIATAEFAQPDFSYLHNFFMTTHAMGSKSKEYAWLDKVLWQNKRYGKHQFGISLHTAYARFVGTFASYFELSRREHYKDPPTQTLDGSELKSNLNQEQNWIELIFGKCEEVSVTKDASSTLTLQIKPVAARCVKANYDFEGRVGLTFYATGENQSIALESLAISTNGGEKIVERSPAETHPDKLGKFTIKARPGIPQYFIVSNVAKKAAGTMEIDFELHVVPEIISTSMAKAKKGPEPKPKPDPTEKEELENAWASQSWTGHAWQRDHSPCTTPFDFRACGPSTHIELTLVSDTAQLLDEVNDPTMSFERKMRVADAIIQRGPEQLPADVRNDVKESQQQDGERIRIQIPQIQPGFVGAVTNAHMTVSRAKNLDGSANFPYRAIGPGWVGPCSGSGLGYWPSSGQVSITEFSQHVLRGTFSADLVAEQYPEHCQPAPISRPISGRFTITEIRWGDNLAPELSEEAILDEVIEDTNELLPGMISDEMAEYIKEQAKKKRLEKEKLKQEKAANEVLPQCRCSCEMETNFCAENPDAECCVSCQPMFRVCKGQHITQSSSLTAEEQANETAEVSAMRQRYEAYIESLGLGGFMDIKEEMMREFDNIPTVDEKRMFMMSIQQ